MRKDIKNIAASVKAQLQNNARETNRPFAEVLQYYAMERFLYRVSKSEYAGTLVLKGALMFAIWHVPERRTTLDIDFSLKQDNQVYSIANIIKDICKVKVVPDGIVFDPERVKGQRIREGADYEGVRVKFTGSLERSRIPMQVDMGFGDSIYPKPKMVKYPSILELPKPKLKGYPMESVVSEKFEAMVKLGLLNSRMKDFYDIWVMMHQFEFNGQELARALKRTFTTRGTSLPGHKPLFAKEIYDSTSDRQSLWKAFIEKSNMKNAPEKLSTTARGIELFLYEPLKAINRKETFNEKWHPHGPWK